MPVDLTEFENLSAPRKKRKPCKVAAAYESKRLSSEDVASLKAAVEVENDRISVGGIVKWAAKRKIDVNPQSILNHRRGKCTCVTE